MIDPAKLQKLLEPLDEIAKRVIAFSQAKPPPIADEHALGPLVGLHQEEFKKLANIDKEVLETQNKLALAAAQKVDDGYIGVLNYVKKVNRPFEGLPIPADALARGMVQVSAQFGLFPQYINPHDEQVPEEIRTYVANLIHYSTGGPKPSLAPDKLPPAWRQAAESTVQELDTQCSAKSLEGILDELQTFVEVPSFEPVQRAMLQFFQSIVPIMSPEEQEKVKQFAESGEPLNLDAFNRFNGMQVRYERWHLAKSTPAVIEHYGHANLESFEDAALAFVEKEAQDALAKDAESLFTTPLIHLVAFAHALSKLQSPKLPKVVSLAERLAEEDADLLPALYRRPELHAAFTTPANYYDDDVRRAKWTYLRRYLDAHRQLDETLDDIFKTAPKDPLLLAERERIRKSAIETLKPYELREPKKEFSTYGRSTEREWQTRTPEQISKELGFYKTYFETLIDPSFSLERMLSHGFEHLEKKMRALHTVYKANTKEAARIWSEYVDLGCAEESVWRALISQHQGKIKDRSFFLLPQLASPGVNRTLAVSKLKSAIEEDYLLAYYQINLGHLQGLFDEAVQQLGLGERKAALVRSVNHALERGAERKKIDISQENRELYARIADHARKDGLWMIENIIEEERLANSAEHLAFIEELAAISGNRSKHNLQSYKNIVYSFGEDQKPRHSGERLAAVQAQMREYLGIGLPHGIKLLTSTLFTHFCNRPTPKSRQEFVVAYNAAKANLLLRPHYVPTGFSDEELETIISETVNIEKFSFNKPNIGGIIRAYKANAVAPLHPSYRKSRVGVKKATADIANQNSEFLEQRINILQGCYRADGTLAPDDEYRRRVTSDITSTLEQIDTKIEKAAKDNPQAAKHLERKREHLRTASELVSSATSSDELLLTSVYLMNTNVDRQVKEEFDRVTERLLVHKGTATRAPEALVKKKEGHSKGKFTRTEVGALATFYAHLHESMDAINIDGYAPLCERLAKAGFALNQDKQRVVAPTAEDINNYFTSLQGQKKPHELLNRKQFNILEREAKYLAEKTRSAEEREPVLFIPARGLIDEFAGAMGNACYFSGEKNFIARYPFITNIRIMKATEEGYELNGSTLFIRRDVDEKGKAVPNLIIRGDNPNLEGLDAADYADKIETYARNQFRAMLQKDGYAGKFYISRPKDVQSNVATTNRAELHAEVFPRIKESPTLHLQEALIFNGFSLQDKCAVVKTGYVKQK